MAKTSLSSRSQLFDQIFVPSTTRFSCAVTRNCCKRALRRRRVRGNRAADSLVPQDLTTSLFSFLQIAIGRLLIVAPAPRLLAPTLGAWTVTNIYTSLKPASPQRR